MSLLLASGSVKYFSSNQDICSIDMFVAWSANLVLVWSMSGIKFLPERAARRGRESVKVLSKWVRPKPVTATFGLKYEESFVVGSLPGVSTVVSFDFIVPTAISRVSAG